MVRKERNYKKSVDKWVWHAFSNPARGPKDTLQLHHWTKAKETDEAYPFAKFNRKVEVIRYANDDEYSKAIHLLNQRPLGQVTNTDWTKEETDHLFDLCDQFSLRFIVIADRFGLTFTPSSSSSSSKYPQQQRKRDAKFASKTTAAVVERTVDEIKERYYSVARAVLEVRGQVEH